jgi:hypothetical protein
VSLEFLIGRCLQNAVLNLGLEDNYADALKDLGYKLEELYEEEIDPALGNGGLGYSNHFQICKSSGRVFHGLVGNPQLPSLGLRYQVQLWNLQTTDLARKTSRGRLNLTMLP